MCFADKEGLEASMEGRAEMESRLKIHYFDDIDESRAYNTLNFGKIEKRQRVSNDTEMYRPHPD